MIITCKACNTSFNLDDKMVKPSGSKVRCSVCANIFTAFPPQAPAPEPSVPPVETDSPPPPAETDVDALSAGAPETSPVDESADQAAPEEDVLEEDVGDLFAGGTDLDFALEDGPEDDVPGADIEDAVSEALEEDLSGPGDDSDTAPPDESDATIIASLDDDDLDLDLPIENEEEDAAATVIADLDKEDLDLDISLEADDNAEGTATVIANLDDESLDLESDFTLETEDEAPTKAAPEDDDLQTLDDLDDLNLTLDMEPEDQKAADDRSEAATAEPSLDDLSLDFDLEDDAEPAKAVEEIDSDQAPEEDVELSLASDEAETSVADASEEAPELEDDLDLSALEGLLDEDEEADDDDVTLVIDDMEGVELSLDIDDEAPPVEGAAAAEESLEDLEFDLDGDSKAESADHDAADDVDQEIDLSEIEKMLEEPEEGNAKFSSVPDQDLDLDIEASLETEKWMSESGDDDQLIEDEELDLSDLEHVLEDVDKEPSDEASEDAELDLDLSDDASLGSPTDTVAVDDLDFDLSEFEDAPAPKTETDAPGREPADMELEFEVEDDTRAEQTLEDEGLEETVAIPEPAARQTAKAPSKPVEEAAPPKPKKAKPTKKGVSKSLVFLLVIVILGGGGYGTYYLLKQNGIEVPFISDYFKPKVNDPGNLKLTTYDINSKFIDNANVGKLFVVTGKVKNGYTENRGMVTLAGKIFSTGKVQVQQEKVYCGNIMSDLELANLEWDKIKARLSNRLGDNRSNVKIEPGQSIPFMVVFSNLPEDLEEFTIEVTGSTSLK